MSLPQDDPYVGMTAEDKARAIAYQAEQRAIQRKREAAARALLVRDQGPANAVKAAWQPVRQALDAQKAVTGTGGQENADKPGGGRNGAH